MKGADAIAALVVTRQQLRDEATFRVWVEGREVQLRVPSFAVTGMRLRLRREAPRGGDLYVQIQVADEPAPQEPTHMDHRFGRHEVGPAYRIVSWLKAFFQRRRSLEAPGPVAAPAQIGSIPLSELLAGAGPMPAEEVLRRVVELQNVNAQWPQIWQALNPDEDLETQKLLIEFRGPYMFAPHTALAVLRIGCQRAMNSSSTATRLEALRQAMSADDRIVHPR